MLIEWESNERKRQGLKEYLEYDETYYIALIKNYQDMGWLEEADDAYYTYRVEKRQARLKGKKLANRIGFEEFQSYLDDEQLFLHLFYVNRATTLNPLTTRHEIPDLLLNFWWQLNLNLLVVGIRCGFFVSPCSATLFFACHDLSPRCWIGLFVVIIGATGEQIQGIKHRRSRSHSPTCLPQRCGSQQRFCRLQSKD